MKAFHPARFRFPSLMAIAAVTAMLGLAGCGGNGGDGSLSSMDTLAKDSAATGGPSTGGTSTSGAISAVPSGNSGSSVISLPPPSPVTGSSTLRLTSSTTGTGLPFSAGYAFRRGDIPSGKYITANNGNLRGFQAVVKNRWHDGSVKFAVLSGLIDLQANSEQTLTIGWTDAAPSGATQGLASLKATGISTSISFGSYGTASWSGNDWDSPFLSPVSGSEMSSWVYRKPIGLDQHLVAWLEVRLYRGGAVEIVPWIENGYLLRPSPGERSGAVVFSVNGATRFSDSITLYNHTRAVLASGQVLSHWLNGEPGITFRHDTGYLQLTGLVPAYRGVTTASSSAMNSLATTYTPLAQANYPNTMGAAGYDPSIGPLPEWDVVYLTSGGDERAWRAIQVNGYAAGRYGIHFRDESTNRAPLLSTYPNLVLDSTSGVGGTGASTQNQYTPAASGGTNANFATTHMPSIGFLAYLVTGRWYFLDEMQLLASILLLKQTDRVREYSRGIIQTAAGANTVRGTAWTVRALTHAASMTPDDDTAAKNQLIGVIENNVDWYHARYVAIPSNPLGVVEPYGGDFTPGDNKLEAAIWQDDFLTWAFANIKPHEVVGDATGTRLTAFLEWKFRSIIGRLGANQSGNWSYRNAAIYYAPIAPSETLDWANGTGPWYTDWGQAYAAANLGYDAGNSLLGAYITGTGLATSYWGNLQPAIAYAVEFGASGALEAYNRMVGADNWQTAATYFNTESPVWSVRPRNLDY